MITLYSLFGKKIGFLLFILIWGVNFSTNQSSEAAALNFSKSPKKPAGRLWRPFIQTPPSISIVCIIECSLIKTGFLARLARSEKLIYGFRSLSLSFCVESFVIRSRHIAKPKSVSGNLKTTASHVCETLLNNDVAKVYQMCFYHINRKYILFYIRLEIFHQPIK